MYRRSCVWGLWLLLWGCVNVSGEGQVVGWLSLSDCSASEDYEAVCADEVPDLECAAFDLETDFYALELFDEQTGKLRLQRGGASFHHTNGLVIERAGDIQRLRAIGTCLTEH